jgi:DNA transposition AAA+ family ATPase
MQLLRDERHNSREVVETVLLSTYNFQRVQEVCDDAMGNHKMIAICGDPGLGKTTSLRYYQQRHKNVFLLTVKPSMTPKSFWESLFDKVTTSDKALVGMTSRRPLYYTLQAVANLLNSYDRSLLIIDEAGKLDAPMLEHLHEVRDDTASSTGIVLSGPEYFKRNLSQWVASERIGMPEIWRRINYWESLVAPEKSEIKEFCRHYKITDEQVIRKLISECKNFGTLYNKIVEYRAGNYKA